MFTKSHERSHLKGALFAALTLSFYLVPTADSQAAQESLNLQQGDTLRHPSRMLYFRSDPNRNLNIQNLANAKLDSNWMTSKSWNISNGFNSQPHWVSLKLANTTPVELQRLLVIDNPLLDSIEVFLVRHPANAPPEISPIRPVESQSGLYLFTLPPGDEALFLIRAQSSVSLRIPVEIWNREAYVFAQKSTVRGQGLVYGFLFAALLINLLFYMRLKKNNSLYFMGMVAMVIAYQAATDGIVQQHLWPGVLPWSGGAFLRISMALGIVFLLAYSQELLLLDKLLPQLVQPVRIMIGFFSGIALITGLGLIPAHWTFAGPLSVVVVIGLAHSAHKIRKNPRVQSHLLSFFLIPTLILVSFHVLYLLGALGPSIITRYALSAAMVLFLFGLSITEAARLIRVSKNESRHAVDALAAQRKAADYLFSEVAKRTRDYKRKEREAQNARKEAQENLDELRSTQTQLVQAEKMSSLGQLVAGVAHEINNPVNFIQNCFAGVVKSVDEIEGTLNDILPDGEAGERARALFEEPFEKITELSGHHEMGTHRVVAIVKSLTSFARLDQAGLQSANANQILEETLLILSNRVKNIQLLKELGDLPPTACHPAKIGQVFLNIIGNALDASSDHKPAEDIQIVLESAVKGKDIVITITDNGPGIDESITSTLFDPFVTTKPIGSGTGMGLAISYNIMKEHEGRIEVSSSQSGTSFSVFLPIKTPPPDQPIQAKVQ